jgi:hypothetical protein
VKYEMGFHIPEDGILQIHRRENLICHIRKQTSAFVESLKMKYLDGALSNFGTAYLHD